MSVLVSVLVLVLPSPQRQSVSFRFVSVCGHQKNTDANDVSSLLHKVFLVSSLKRNNDEGTTFQSIQSINR